jgi:hypothetical protein
VGLVRELEAKRATERQKLAEAIRNYLTGLGVKVVLVEEPAIGNFGGDINQPVIQLKGCSVDKIRLTSADYISCSIVSSISRFEYEVFIDKKLTRELSQRLGAKTKVVKEKKKLGLFGGKIVGVNWAGRDLADRLNRDSEISQVLLGCTRSLGNPEFQIQTKSPSTVIILSPSFTEPQRIMELFELGGKDQFEDCVFGFKICDRIAIHARELVNAL